MELQWITSTLNSHLVDPDNTEAAIWHHLRNFVDLLPERMSDPAKEERRQRHLPSFHDLKAEVVRVERLIKEAPNSPLVFCHNDLLVGNIVWNRYVGEALWR